MGKIQSFRDLQRFIDSDLRSRCVQLSVRNFVVDPIVRFTLALRLNEYLHNSNKNFLLRVIPKWYFKRISIRLGFSIPLNVFDEGLAVVHYGTVIVSPSAIVGKNCRIHAGVNIGGVGGRAAVDRGDRIAPIIGDDCYLGPGAKIYGPIDIGNRCVIGANAVVGRSFGSDNLTIAGVPARVIVSRDVEGDSGNVLDQVESAGRE